MPATTATSIPAPTSTPAPTDTAVPPPPPPPPPATPTEIPTAVPAPTNAPVVAPPSVTPAPVMPTATAVPVMATATTAPAIPTATSIPARPSATPPAPTATRMPTRSTGVTPHATATPQSSTVMTTRTPMPHSTPRKKGHARPARLPLSVSLKAHSVVSGHTLAVSIRTAARTNHDRATGDDDEDGCRNQRQARQAGEGYARQATGEGYARQAGQAHRRVVSPRLSGEVQRPWAVRLPSACHLRA